MTLTSGSCSPLSRVSRRWRPLSLWDCSSVHSSSPRVTRRSPNLSSIRSHCRDFPEPGPPESTHTHGNASMDRSSPPTSNHWEYKVRVGWRGGKLRGERSEWKRTEIGNRWCASVRVCLTGLIHCQGLIGRSSQKSTSHMLVVLYLWGHLIDIILSQALNPNLNQWWHVTMLYFSSY